jgi:hypothetical protein
LVSNRKDGATVASPRPAPTVRANSKTIFIHLSPHGNARPRLPRPPSIHLKREARALVTLQVLMRRRLGRSGSQALLSQLKHGSPDQAKLYSCLYCSRCRKANMAGRHVVLLRPRSRIVVRPITWHILLETHSNPRCFLYSARKIPAALTGLFAT